MQTAWKGDHKFTGGSKLEKWQSQRKSYMAVKLTLFYSVSESTLIQWIEDHI